MCTLCHVIIPRYLTHLILCGCQPVRGLHVRPGSVLACPDTHLKEIRPGLIIIIIFHRHTGAGGQVRYRRPWNIPGLSGARNLVEESCLVTSPLLLHFSLNTVAILSHFLLVN